MATTSAPAKTWGPPWSADDECRVWLRMKCSTPSCGQTHLFHDRLVEGILRNLLTLLSGGIIRWQT